MLAARTGHEKCMTATNEEDAEIKEVLEEKRKRTAGGSNQKRYKNIHEEERTLAGDKRNRETNETG